MEKNSTPSICKMGCGFFGNHLLEGMCSKCHKESVLSKSGTGRTGINQSNSSCEKEKAKKKPLQKDVVTAKDIETADSKKNSPSSTEISVKEGASSASSSEGGSSSNPPKKRNRCFSCRKKVGLTGCECRCGEIFCGLHRYSDKHNCTFDYKTDGRKRLAQENPVIVGEKN